MVAGRQAQYLRHALGRLVIFVDGRVQYPDPHDRKLRWRRIPIQTAWLREKLLGHQRAQTIILGNEFADELVQSSLEYAVHTAILKTHANASRMPLRRTLATIGPRD